MVRETSNWVALLLSARDGGGKREGLDRLSLKCFYLNKNVSSNIVLRFVV